MGHVMQRVKTSPRRTFLTYFLAAVALIVVAWVAYNWTTSNRAEISMQWIRFYDGDLKNIEDLKKETETYPGKASRFQLAWLLYWDFGVKTAATDKAGAIERLQQAVVLYGQLADECKDDPVFEPQALLGRAVAQESLAVQDRKVHLKKAEQHYEEIVTIHDKKYEKYAEGKFAQQRLDILKNEAKRRDLVNDYESLQRLLGIAPPRMAQDDNPLFQGLDIPKKK
jgi:hypothetical protein